MDASVTTSSAGKSLETDWERCCLCQTDKNEELKCPPTRYDKKESDGYAMIARNLPLFKSINQMAIIMDIARLDNGTGIEETLRQMNAKYHQSCRLLFNNSKLERARKRSLNEKESGECSKPIKSRRSSLENNMCFLCAQEAPKSDLRRAMTMELDRRLNECARNLEDGKLLATLSAGDVVAQELKYHCNCLRALYNRERDYMTRKENRESQSSKDKDIYPLVLSELLVYVVETKSNADGPAVFRLADLVSLYKQRLQQLGVEEPNVNATRLKEKLMEEIPELEAHRKGRDILLAFKKDVGEALAQAVEYSDALIVTKAASILRKHMIEHKTTFNGTFHDNCIADSAPPLLLQFVCMIEHGANIKSQLRFGASKTDLTMTQLLQYNCYAKYKEGAKTFRHSKDRETPFPVFLGMSTYAKTRKKLLVDMLHEHGLSISYDRVLEISAQLGDAAVRRYNEEGVVCPSDLRKDLFTTAAMDNIDHNPTATTATSSFHGTSISVFQHPTTDNQGIPRERNTIDKRVKKVPELPDSYTNIYPAFFTQKQPSPTNFQTPLVMPTLQLKPEFDWLHEVSITESVDDDHVNLSWSAYHASMKRSSEFEVSITSLLPLLRDEAHSVATIRHVMDRVREIVSLLNPGQVPVIAADQPLYALAKQIQWHWPDRYGEDKFVIMFGGLHIEMAAFKSIGSLLQDSGWTNALVEAGIASSGTAESFLSASSVTRTRQAHQVTSCALYKLQTEAYKRMVVDVHENLDPYPTFEEWCKYREADSPQFQFWNLILRMELTIFSLIRSFREENFDLYCQSLQGLLPYFFANNNVNYARWLPVHLRDMLSLEEKHPAIATEFSNGKFVVHKSGRDFSALAIDQAHEQANAIIKGDGGAIGITEDESALRRWMLSGPEVCYIKAQYEALSEQKDANESTQHHEQTRTFQTSFLDKVNNLYSVMTEMGNPYMDESKELVTLDTKHVAHPTAAEMVSQHFQKGTTSLEKFFESLQDGENCKFYEPIKKNKTNFFRQQPETSSKDLKQKNVKDDCTLFSKLFISCQSRECDLQDFFQHENQSYPASLSDGGNLYSCQKSQLAMILQNQVTLSDDEPSVEAIIIDGSAFVNSVQPRIARTFEEYATLEIIPKIDSFSARYQRTDIVFDVYKADSLKAETRSRRGYGARRRVTDKGNIPQNWQSFLRDNTNKTELFSFLADKIVELCRTNTVIVTRLDGVVYNKPINTQGLMPCNHEEADTRMFVHARHAVVEGIKSVMIKANDTDVLVIGISVLSSLQNLGLENLWIDFGQGKNQRWIPVHDINSALGSEKAAGLPFFHAFTGCDVVSAFRGKGKKTAWQTWNVCPDVTSVFSKLSKYPSEMSEVDQDILEMYVIALYDKSSPTSNINDARLDLFARKQRSYDSIPPTRGALVEHIKRATYMAGCIWGQSVSCNMSIVSPGGFGWIKKGDTWQIVWTKVAPIAESCQQLTKCGCKSECRGRCKCFKLSLPCTALCSCKC